MSASKAVFEVGKDIHRPAYFDDWADVSPITLRSAASLASTYPVGPTRTTCTCSSTDPRFTVMVCVPEVGPVSPTTWMVVPLSVAVETKWTPWPWVALIVAVYSAAGAGLPLGARRGGASRPRAWPAPNAATGADGDRRSRGGVLICAA